MIVMGALVDILNLNTCCEHNGVSSFSVRVCQHFSFFVVLVVAPLLHYIIVEIKPLLVIFLLLFVCEFIVIIISLGINSLPIGCLIAQLIEHCTGITRVWIQIPFQPFFQAFSVWSVEKSSKTAMITSTLYCSSIWTSLILSIDLSAYFNWLCYCFATVVLSIFSTDWLVLCKTAI